MANRAGRINRKDRDIFRSLFLAKRPLPLSKIANRTNMSWKTAQKRTERLEHLGAVKINKTPRRTNITLTPSLLSALRKLRKR